jgi:hypothetical protein
MKDLLSFGLTLEKQAGMTQSSFPLNPLLKEPSLTRPLTPEAISRAGQREAIKTPAPEQWRAHKGVIVDDALNGLKLMSIPLFAYGLYRMAREGVLTDGLGYMAVWPILEVLTPRKEV